MSEKKDALKAEAANADEATFEYGGVKYTVEPMDKWVPDAVEALENDKIVTCVHHVLGEAQYRKFKATKPTMKEFGELSDALFKALEGVSAGE